KFRGLSPSMRLNECETHSLKAAEERLGTAGQQEGRHHEHNQSRAGRRILEPHHRPSRWWRDVLVLFLPQNKNKTGSNTLPTTLLYVTKMIFILPVKRVVDT